MERDVGRGRRQWLLKRPKWEMEIFLVRSKVRTNPHRRIMLKKRSTAVRPIARVMLMACELSIAYCQWLQRMVGL
jgi:hypothetical protein